METGSKWSVAAFIAAAVLAAGCDSHHEVDTAQQLKIASAAVAAKSDDVAPGTDQAIEDSSLTATVLGDPRGPEAPVPASRSGVVDSWALRERAVETRNRSMASRAGPDRLRVRN
jgi:hypothetical protein